MVLVLSMWAIVTLFGVPIDAPLTILIEAAVVACIALGFLGLQERAGGLDKFPLVRSRFMSSWRRM